MDSLRGSFCKSGSCLNIQIYPDTGISYMHLYLFEPLKSCGSDNWHFRPDNKRVNPGIAGPSSWLCFRIAGFFKGVKTLTLEIA